jgi:hypothetical protein
MHKRPLKVKAHASKSLMDSRATKAAKAPLMARRTVKDSSSKTPTSSSLRTKVPAPSIGGSGRLIAPKFSAEAPAAVSTMSHRHFEMAGNLFTGVRCRVLEPFAGVCYPQSTVYDMGQGAYPAWQLGASFNGTTVLTASTPYTMALNPIAMPCYFAANSTQWYTGVAFSDSNVLTLIASAFSRYRIHSLKFHYRPACPTDTSGLLCFGYSEDCSHPLIGVSEFSNSNYPGISTLENGSNSVVFAPWLPWSMAVPVDTAPRYLSVDGVYAETTSSVVYDAADIRHTNFASACLLANTNSSAGAIRLGEMYWEIDIDLYDAVPLSLSYSIPLLLRIGAVGHGFKGLSKSSHKISGLLSAEPTTMSTLDFTDDEEESPSPLAPLAGEGKEERKEPPTPPPTPAPQASGALGAREGGFPSSLHTGSLHAHQLTSFRHAGLKAPGTK